MQYKSIYGTQLQIRDTILYWYQLEGVMKYCIGRVCNMHEDISYDKSYIQVDRMLQSWLSGKWKRVNNKVRLKNPNFLIVGTEVENPFEQQIIN